MDPIVSNISLHGAAHCVGGCFVTKIRPVGRTFTGGDAFENQSRGPCRYQDNQGLLAIRGSRHNLYRLSEKPE
jgi:hypothetical protein